MSKLRHFPIYEKYFTLPVNLCELKILPGTTRTHTQRDLGLRKRGRRRKYKE